MKLTARRVLVLITLFALVLSGCKTVPWTEYSSTEGQFSVLLPAAPTTDVKPVATQSGQVEMHFYSLTTGNTDYLISYADYPISLFQNTPIKSILDGARDGAVKNSQGRLITESDISLDSYPGREINVESSDSANLMRAHLYVVNQRLYQVIVITPRASAGSADVTKFLDSFQLATPANPLPTVAP